MATNDNDLQKVIAQIAPTLTKLILNSVVTGAPSTSGSYLGSLGALLGLIDPKLTGIGSSLGYSAPAVLQALSTGDWSGITNLTAGSLGGGLGSLLGGLITDEPYGPAAGNLAGQLLGRLGYGALTDTSLLQSLGSNVPTVNLGNLDLSSLGLGNLNLSGVPLLNIAGALSNLISIGNPFSSDDPYGAAAGIADTAITTGLSFIPVYGWIAAALFNLFKSIPAVNEFLMEETPYGLGTKGLGDVFSGDMEGLTELAVALLTGAPPEQYSKVFGETDAERAARHAQEQMLVEIAKQVNDQYQQYGMEGLQDPEFRKAVNEAASSAGIMGMPKGEEALERYAKQQSGFDIMMSMANPQAYKIMMTNTDKPVQAKPDQLLWDEYYKIAAEQGADSQEAMKILARIYNPQTVEMKRQGEQDYWTEYGAWLADQGLVETAPSSPQDWQKFIGQGLRGAYKGQDVMMPNWEGYVTQMQQYPYQQAQSEALQLNQYLKQNPQYLTQYAGTTQDRFAKQQMIPTYATISSGNWLDEDMWQQIWGNTFYGNMYI